MDDAIAERRRADGAPFRLVNGEAGIRSGLVGACAQLVMQFGQAIADLVLEGGDGVRAALAARGLAIGQP